MESSGLPSQLLSVMEVLAKAAVAEIHRSVDDRCAVLRLEVSRSRRDIDRLKRQCDGMEAELRRTRRRARRKGLYPPAAERCSPGVSVLDKESSCWAAEALQAQQVDPDHEAELFLIKEEFAEEDKRLSGADQSPCFNGFAERYLSPGVGPAFLPDGYNEDEAELGVKREEEEDEEEELDEEELDEEELDEEELDEEELEEEEPDENAAPLLDSTEAVDRPPWSPSPSDPRGGDAVDPRGERQSEPPPFGFPPRCGPRPEDAAAPQAHALGRSHAASAAAARARRRARALLGCRRPPPDAGHGAPSHINAADQAPPPHPTQLHYRDPNAENPAAAASSFLVRGGGGLFGGGGVFGLARRMRTPWRSGVGEKRFNCTFCDKGFARFSQLKEHLRSHTGEKPFSCLQCGRSFTKQCNLIRHAVVHSGEKPYACALCGKCFTQRSSLKSHQKTAH